MKHMSTRLVPGASPVGFGLTICFLFVSAASAQTATTQAGAVPTDSAKLEEIVVTAEKRSENLKSVPISAQVVSGQVLAEQNFNSFDALAETLPGVHVGNSAGSFSNDLYIRGIGSGIGGGNTSFDQSVSMFDDDIYHGRSRLSGATFLDIDQVEILKGPQSTFFGNNAIAGALNITTRKPGDTFDGWARALYGMYGQYAAEGAVTLPISDTLAVRAAATFNGGSGWIKNIDTGSDAPDVGNKAGRITGVYRATSDLDVTLKIEGSDNRVLGTSGDSPFQWSDCPPAAPITPQAFGGGCASALALNLPIGFNNNQNAGLAGQGSWLSTFEDVLTLNYRQWGQTFTSVSGFYNYHFTANNDPENLGSYLLTNQMIEAYHQFSQEFRVASPTGGVLQYLAGAYFQSDQLDEAEPTNFPFLNFLGPLVGIPAADLPGQWHPNFSQGEHVYSLFGSLGWNVTEALRLNAGLRESEVYKNFFGNNQYGTSTQVYGGYTPVPLSTQQIWGSIPIEGPPGTVNLNRLDHALMPSAGIQYQLNPEAMLYFTYSRGFKAGGFNGTIPFTATPQDLLFGPEHVNAYELGLKSKWLQDTVLLNLDVFRANYEDLQANSLIYEPTITAYTQEVRNAATSRSQGVELEMQWAASENLRFSANVTYLDSIYVNYPNAAPQQLQNYCTGLSQAAFAATPQCAPFGYPVPPFANISGQATNFAPRWSGTVGASYRIMLPKGYQLTTALNPYVTSAYNNQDPYVVGTAGYLRLDGTLTLKSPDAHWSVDVIGKNLTNRVIVTSSPGKEEPWNVAGQVRYRF